MGKGVCSGWEVLCVDHYQQTKKEPAHIPSCLSSPTSVPLAEGNPNFCNTFCTYIVITLETSPSDQQSQYLFKVQRDIAQFSTLLFGRDAG